MKKIVFIILILLIALIATAARVERQWYNNEQYEETSNSGNSTTSYAIVDSSRMIYFDCNGMLKNTDDNDALNYLLIRKSNYLGSIADTFATGTLAAAGEVKWNYANIESKIYVCVKSDSLAPYKVEMLGKGVKW